MNLSPPVLGSALVLCVCVCGVHACVCIHVCGMCMYVCGECMWVHMCMCLCVCACIVFVYTVFQCKYIFCNGCGCDLEAGWPHSQMWGRNWMGWGGLCNCCLIG